MELQKRTSTRPMEVVLVANEKGGVGKTTTSLCLANCLTAMGYQVCILDLDPSANLSCAALPENPALSLYDVFDKRIPLSEILVKTPFGYVAPSIKDVPDLGGDLSAPVESKSLTQIANRWLSVRGAEYMLTALLRNDKRFNPSEYFDFVIIDSAPSDNILITNAIIAADAVIVPCELAAASINGLQMFLGSIANTHQYYKTNVGFDGMLMVKYSEKAGSDRNMAKIIDELCEAYDIRRYNTKIRHSDTMRTAMDNCRPILDYLNVGNAATDSINMALEFLQKRDLAPLTHSPYITQEENGKLVYRKPAKCGKEA